MKIAIDLQGLQAGSKYRGIGRYINELIKSLIESLENHEIILVFNDGLEIELPERIKSSENVQLIGLRFLDKIAYIHNAEWNRGVSSLIFSHFLNRTGIDYFLITSPMEGWGDDFVSMSSVDLEVPTGVILYDLIPLIYPEDYLPDTRSKKWYEDYSLIYKKAVDVFCISDSAKDDSIEYLNIDQDRLSVVYGDTSEYFQLEESSSHSLESLARLGINSDYLMYTSATDPRKNHLRLITAYSRLPNEIKSKYLLVIAGGLDALTERKFRAHAKLEGVDERLVITGRVSDFDLKTLYQNTSLFVFPSLHEGFGLPVLEAMRCGAPVCASNQSSIPEVAGVNAAYFNPLDVEDMVDVITKILVNEKTRLDLIEHSHEQQSVFSWERTAKIIAKRIVNTAPLSDKFGPEDGHITTLLHEISKVKGCYEDNDLRLVAKSIAFNESILNGFNYGALK